MLWACLMSLRKGLSQAPNKVWIIANAIYVKMVISASSIPSNIYGVLTGIGLIYGGMRMKQSRSIIVQKVRLGWVELGYQ